MMELVDREQRVVEELLVDCVVSEAKRCVRAYQHRVWALEEALDRGDLGAVGTRRAEIVLGQDLPVGEEARVGEIRGSQKMRQSSAPVPRR